LALTSSFFGRLERGNQASERDGKKKSQVLIKFDKIDLIDASFDDITLLIRRSCCGGFI
jgi:hypothetical protein